MRASLYSAFKISTRCCSPTERSPSRASGSTFSPKRCEISISFFRPAETFEPIDQRLSVPVMTFSSTVRFGANEKCWCTMPTPARIAARGFPGGSICPITETEPVSGT
ncbi:hypothetical protein D3C73_687320 [compost metagenome]